MDAMTVFLAACYLGMALCAISIIKCAIIRKFRCRAREMALDRAIEIIDSTGRRQSWKDAWKVKESYPSAKQMVLNPFIWTFNQAYPDLEKRLREL